jgi:transglutaminase-like putative cysteine protease
MFYRVTHTTTYEYSTPVSLCQNLVHLTPREVAYQARLQSELTVTPQPHVLSPRTDYFGNPVTFFAIQTPHRRLSVKGVHVVERSAPPLPQPCDTEPWERARDALPADRNPAVLEAYQYVFDSRYARAAPELADYALLSFGPGRPLLDAVLDLTRRIHADFRYDPRATTVSTPLSQVFATRRGVCQDFAHLEIACLRSLGLPARYVSGYLGTNTPAGQARPVGADASHAWLSVFLLGFGWVDVDPTNNQVPTERHVLLAWGLDYDDVSPVKGIILGGGEHDITVSVDVQAFQPAMPRAELLHEPEAHAPGS